jgi:DNA-binding transcriptional regulator YhcF (GntR family)
LKARKGQRISFNEGDAADVRNTFHAEVISFPKKATRNPSSVEKIWGKPVCTHGYAGIPSILIQAQRRLGINPTQMNIIIQLLDYWREPARKPFPSKNELAKRIGVTAKTIQTNIRELEKAGLILRQLRKTVAGDWNSNIYHLDGLVKKVQALEPEFTEARKRREAERAMLETPAGMRKAK